MASRDPSNTGGLFVGRPADSRHEGFHQHELAGPSRRLFDRTLAALILCLETLLCLSVWGPQPLAWLWIGSRIQYLTGSITIGLLSSLFGMLFLLLLTLGVAKRVDNVWKLVRRAAGHDQQRGALERIFVASVAVATCAFAVWFFVIAGPGPQLAPRM
jgi:protein-S-isoprenylcysteine O-methyltransferase Ste14